MQYVKAAHRWSISWKIVICNICNDDWNIGHRKWSKKSFVNEAPGPCFLRKNNFPCFSDVRDIFVFDAKMNVSSCNVVKSLKSDMALYNENTWEFSSQFVQVICSHLFNLDGKKFTLNWLKKLPRFINFKNMWSIMWMISNKVLVRII
jgi:hypothetical protein